ncbi:ion transporter [Puteibacter caeruleilacunae]|nr:ion transporter [Puteibacter caeruleilacunae]
MKTRIYNIVEKGSHGKRTNRIFDYVILVLILASVTTIVLQSVPEIDAAYHDFFISFNIFSVIVFSIEYLLRLYVSDLTHPAKNRFRSALKFITSGYGIIDLLAILPFYLPFFMKVDLRFLRAVRLTRFLRILKVNRYNDSLGLIWSVVKEKKEELAVTGFLTFLVLLLSSFIMYYVEGKVQPDKFPNILSSFWWAVATLTTVGYGDVYPITAVGKFISGVIALLGIGIVALPTGIIGSGFMEKVSETRQKKKVHRCPHCGETFEEE